MFTLAACARSSPASSAQTRHAQHHAVNRNGSPSPESIAFEIQGHRGCRGLMPENTLPAFLHAMELGITVLELDVVISADGQVVVSHEPWINPEICRIGSGPVAQEPTGATELQAEDSERGKALHFGVLTYADIVRYDCGSQPHPRFPGQKTQPTVKPLLRDLLLQTEARARETGQPVAYNIELKSRPEWDGLEQPGPETALPLLLAVMKESGVWTRWHLQSFDYRVLRLARALEPSLPLVQLVEENPVMALELKRLGFEPAVYSPWFKLVTPAMVKSAHKRGIRVIPWTVNEPADMLRMREMGVDGLITDYPDRALALPKMH
ncbi:MAG: glycerophosphodiester phosphodiesterase [Bacteroidetes bacterium]|nr:glycerophosphodiester phosphodiesterase [Bacteroidota bacterium]